VPKAPFFDQFDSPVVSLSGFYPLGGFRISIKRNSRPGRSGYGRWA